MKSTITAVFLFMQYWVFSQSFTEKINKELMFEKKGVNNALLIANINGSVTVTGYDGEKIMVEVTRTIKAKTPERLENAKAHIRLGFLDRADTLIFYTEGLCSRFGKTSKKKGDWTHKNGWGYLWSEGKDDCDEKADYSFDYVVRVPKSVNLLVSTVNQGDLKIENVAGGVVANNVNGSIELTGLSREASAHTINGDVDISYEKNPQKPCRFYTLNGDINAWFQKGLAAELSFESFNGELYTNVNGLESLPVQMEKESTKNGVKYKINGNRFKIGAGGVLLDFETFNGNVYLKEKI
ncbi:MAG: hypothetical protein JNJ65_14975 [Cyclobacteriaceae bacterium]|nr:hypothetical protein [Cyclobacteriaceae bacterium]